MARPSELRRALDAALRRRAISPATYWRGRVALVSGSVPPTLLKSLRAAADAAVDPDREPPALEGVAERGGEEPNEVERKAAAMLRQEFLELAVAAYRAERISSEDLSAVEAAYSLSAPVPGRILQAVLADDAHSARTGITRQHLRQPLVDRKR